MSKPDTYTISKSELRDIIKQEIESVMKERSLKEINPYHKGAGKDGGQFTSKKAGKVYSVPHKHKDKVKNIPTGRGLNKNGRPVARFGMNSGSPDKQCGRVTVDGEKKKKTRRCDGYKKNYWDSVDEGIDIITGMPESDELSDQKKTKQARQDQIGVMPKELARLARGVMEARDFDSGASEMWEATSTLRRLSGLPEGLVSPADSPLAQKCKAAGFRTFEDLLRAMDAMHRASNGKLTEPATKAKG